MNQDYYFYELGDTKENNNTLMGDPLSNHPSKKSTDSLLPLIASVLVTLVTLAISIISWVLFHKNRSSIILAHSIISTVAFVFSVLIVVWALGVRKFNMTGMLPAPIITFLVFIGGIVFSSYFIASCLFIWTHLSFHLDYLTSTSMRPADWSFYFWDYSVEFAKSEDWKLYLTIVILAVVASGLFAILSQAAWSVSENWYELKKWALCLGLIATTVFGFLIMIWYQDNKLIFSVIRQNLFSSTSNVSYAVFILSTIAVGLALLNSFINFVKNRFLHFIIGCIFGILSLIILIYVAFLFRDVLRFVGAKPVSNITAAALTHSKYYSDLCVDKYLPEGKVGNAGIVYRFEADPLRSMSLNPDCTPVSNDALIWSYYIMSVFTILLLTSTAVVTASNLSLGWKGKHDYSSRNLAIHDLVAIVIVVCLCIALSLYLIFRPEPESVSRFTSPNSQYNIVEGNLIFNPKFTGKL